MGTYWSFPSLCGGHNPTCKAEENICIFTQFSFVLDFYTNLSGSAFSSSELALMSLFYLGKNKTPKSFFFNLELCILNLSLGHSLRIHEGNEHYTGEEILYNINPQIVCWRQWTWHYVNLENNSEMFLNAELRGHWCHLALLIEVFSPGSFSGDVNLSPNKTIFSNDVSG